MSFKCQFLAALAEACGKTAWQIHAYRLMKNHFHLVAETPDANLVFGMKWLLGTYTKRFNIRHKLCGHLFAGDTESWGYNEDAMPMLLHIVVSSSPNYDTFTHTGVIAISAHSCQRQLVP